MVTCTTPPFRAAVRLNSGVRPENRPQGNMKQKAPPVPVVIAAWLFMAYGLLSLFRIWLFGSGFPSSTAGILIWCAAIACLTFVARSLYAGRNWVRWLLTVLVAVSVVTFPFQKPDIPDGPQVWLYALQIAMPIAVCALTFTRSARTWFQA